MKSSTRIVSVITVIIVALSGCSSEAPVAQTVTVMGTSTMAATTHSSSLEQVDPSSSAGPSAHSAAAASGSSDESSSSPAPDSMPDLVGRKESEARALLVPMNARIKIESRISAEAVGTVVDQYPVAGAPFSSSVVLTVSVAPPKVPDVTGRPAAEAVTALEALGFTVVEEPTFNSEQVDGLVVAQTPPADSPNASEVTLTVVRRPFVVYLSDLSYIVRPACVPEYGTNNCIGYGQQKANATSYSHAISINPPPSEVQDLEYDLSRQYRRLIGDIGLGDRSAAQANGRVEIYGDGRLLHEYSVAFGTTTPVDVDISDVLRLRISLTTDRAGTTLVLGDWQIQGVPTEINSSAPATTSETTR